MTLRRRGARGRPRDIARTGNGPWAGPGDLPQLRKHHLGRPNTGQPLWSQAPEPAHGAFPTREASPGLPQGPFPPRTAGKMQDLGPFPQLAHPIGRVTGQVPRPERAFPRLPFAHHGPVKGGRGRGRGRVATLSSPPIPTPIPQPPAPPQAQSPTSRKAKRYCIHCKMYPSVGTLRSVTGRKTTYPFNRRPHGSVLS